MAKRRLRSSKKKPGKKTAECLKTPEKDNCEQLTYSETPVPRENRRRSVVVAESKQKSPASENEKDASSDSAKAKSKIYYQRDESALDKVRVSLFHEVEKNNEPKGKAFSVNATSFYGPSNKERVLPLAPDLLGTTRKKLEKSKSNLSPYDIPTRKGRKRQSGNINGGVGHAIKKFKDTRGSIKKEILEMDEHIVAEEQCGTSQKENAKEIENPETSPEDYNPNKKFFKHRRPEKKLEISLGNKPKQRKMKQKETHVSCSNLFGNFKSKKQFCEPLNARHSTQSNKTAPSPSECRLNILKEEKFNNNCQHQQNTQKLVSTLSNVIGDHLNNADGSCNLEIETENEVTEGTDEELPYLNSAIDIENNNFISNETVMELASHDTEEFKSQMSGGSSMFFMESSVSDVISEKNQFDESLSDNRSLECNPKEYEMKDEQSDIKNIECQECSFVYKLGNKNEELAHSDYHNDFSGFNFQELKSNHEIIIDEGNESKIVVIKPFDSECQRKKAFDVLKVINKELSLSYSELIDNHEKYFFVFTKKKMIMGVLIAEYLEFASILELNSSAPTRMFSEIIPVKCGVKGIWVSKNHRRQGIATTMMDSLRNHFFNNYQMTLDDLAISIPTPIGRLFAEKYMGSSNFKVF